MRLFGLIAIGFWLTMMTLLVKRDVLPAFGRRGDPGYRALLMGRQGMDETHMGIFIGEQKIGYAHEVIRPNADGGYQITEETEFNGSKLGLEALMTFRSTTNIDAAFRLASFEMNARILGSEASVKGTVVEDELVVTIGGILANGQHEEKRISMDGPMTLSTGISPFTEMPELEVGKEWTIVSVNPLDAARGSLTTEMRRARVESKEKILWEDVPTEVYVVKIESHQAFARECTAWITRDGTILKQRVGILEMRRER